MFRTAQKIALPLTLAVAVLAAADAVGVRKAIEALWIEPRDVEARDMFYGAGGKAHAPQGNEFQFVKEDDDGTTPKYIVTDADGVKWKIKLGIEAKPETAASRFVWAAGYHAHEIYFLPDVRVNNMPEDLKRGKNLVAPDGSMQNVRLLRINPHEKKIGTWKWSDSPFEDTKEFNGLRVLMAVINNWDLKDVNNAIYEDVPGNVKYLVSDLGGTFGTTGITWSKSDWKGNLEAYRRSKFIKPANGDSIDFAAPSRPAVVGVFAPGNFVRRIRMQWIGKDIPLDHARWMGEMLGRLSPPQIRDAFRGAGFSPEEVEGFAEVMEQRIAQLKAL